MEITLSRAEVTAIHKMLSDHTVKDVLKDARLEITVELEVKERKK